MLETIIYKQCSKCKEVKPISEFYKDRAQKSGYRPSCKACKRKYQQSDAGKESIRRYYRKHPDKIATYRRKYQKTEAFRDAIHRFARTEKGKACKKRLYWKHIDKIRARSAVGSAVKKSTIPAAQTLRCVHCPKPATEYHHHLGYAKEHWLDVIPVCLPCHTGLHP